MFVIELLACLLLIVAILCFNYRVLTRFDRYEIRCFFDRLNGRAHYNIRGEYIGPTVFSQDEDYIPMD